MTSKPGLFVCGTDTEVGKTEVMASLAQIICQQDLNLPIRLRKPVASGCAQHGVAQSCEDTCKLHQAGTIKESHASITPYVYQPSVAPPIAAKMRNEVLYLRQLYQACMIQEECFVLVEGVGGICSPIAEDGTTADLIKKLKIPAVLIIGSRLGCINHALLALYFIHQQNIPLHSIILNDISNDEVALSNHHQQIQKFSQKRLYRVRFVDSSPHHSTQELADSKRWQIIKQQLESQGWRYEHITI